MLATLKAYALVGSRANSMTSAFGSWFSYPWPTFAISVSDGASNRNGRWHTVSHGVQFVNHVLLVVGIGRLEALRREQPWNAFFLDFHMVVERRNGIFVAGE